MEELKPYPACQELWEARRKWDTAEGRAEMRGIDAVMCAIHDLPSAKPERLTDDDFETIRIHLNAYKEKLCNQQRWEEAEEYQRIIDRFMSFASAQQEIIHCGDCKYYHDSDGCFFSTATTGADGFCHWAERKDGEADEC